MLERKHATLATIKKTSAKKRYLSTRQIAFHVNNPLCQFTSVTFLCCLCRLILSPLGISVIALQAIKWVSNVIEQYHRTSGRSVDLVGRAPVY